MNVTTAAPAALAAGTFDGMWRRMFGGDPGVIGQTLTVSNNQYTVVGAPPPSFQFALRQADLWLPYQPTPNQLSRRFMHGTNLIGRLRPGVSLEQAHAETSAITQRIAEEHKESPTGTRLLLTPLQEQVTGSVKPALLALLAAVGFVLLMVCVEGDGTEKEKPQDFHYRPVLRAN